MRSSRVFLSFSLCLFCCFSMFLAFYIWSLQFMFVSMQNLYRCSLFFWAFSDGGCWLYLSVYWGILHSLIWREIKNGKASGFIIVFLFRYRSFWFQGVLLPVFVFHGYLRLHLFDFFQGIYLGCLQSFISFSLLPLKILCFSLRFFPFSPIASPNPIFLFI